jgi:hypothetical protein
MGFKELSIELANLLLDNTDFTDVMVRDGKQYLFPMVASEENTLPLTTYSLGEKRPGTKELNDIAFAVAFWFPVEKYKDCCEFTDKMEGYLEGTVGYNVNSSQIEFNFESKTYTGTINVNLI